MTACIDLFIDLSQLSPNMRLAGAAFLLTFLVYSLISLGLTFTVGHRIADALDPLFKHLVENRIDMYVSNLPFKSDRTMAYCSMIVSPQRNLDIPKAAVYDFHERLGPRLYFWAKVLGYSYIWTVRILLGSSVAILAFAYLNLLRKLGLFRLSTDYLPYIARQLKFWMAAKPTRVYELVLFLLLTYLFIHTLYTRAKYLSRFQPFISKIAKIQFRFTPPTWVLELGHAMHLGIFFGFPHLYRRRMLSTGAWLSPDEIELIPRGTYLIYATAALSFVFGLVVYMLLCMLGFLEP